VSGLFYNLGRMAGPHVRKAKWAWLSATGTEAEAVKAEYDVGLDLAGQIRLELTLDREPDASGVLGEIGTKLSARVANKRRTFSFEIVRSGDPNAFALPGGFIFVTHSLLELCEWNKDQIAFIVGHEMSHVIRGHAMDRIVSNSAIALGARAAPLRGLGGAWLSSVGVKFLQSAYSQDAELEADTLGILLAEAAGYDGRGAVTMLARLAKLTSPARQSDLGAYFSTHPGFEVRTENAKRVLLHAR
jgi:predicted Zn-dependent protease